MPREHDTVEFDDDVDSDDEITHEGESVNGRVQQLENGEILSRLLADPDITAVIRAKQAGQKVKIDLGEEPEEVEEEEDDLTEGLDEKDPATKVLKRIDSLMNKKLEKLLGPISDRVDRFDAFTGNIEKKEVTSQIQSAMERYPDFATYRNKMLKLSQESPSLSVEELYLIARSRSGKLDIKKASTFSEKPTPQAVSRGRKEQKPVQRSTRAARRNLVSEALENIPLRSLEG